MDNESKPCACRRNGPLTLLCDQHSACLHTGPPLDIEFRVARHQDGNLVFYAWGKVLFRISPDGVVHLEEGIAIDEAARGFWEAVAQFNPCRAKMAEAFEEAARIAEQHDIEVQLDTFEAGAIAEKIRAKAREVLG